jgi:hypothetical protein
MERIEPSNLSILMILSVLVEEKATTKKSNHLIWYVFCQRSKAAYLETNTDLKLDIIKECLK